MAANSKLKAIAGKLSARGKTGVRREDLGKDPRIVMRIILAILLVANIAAALALLRPWEESPEEKERRLGQMRAEIQQRERSIERLETLVEKSRRAREEGDEFMEEYFMGRQAASSTIVSELKESASKAGVKQEEHTFAFEAIEGSENLSMMSVSGNYEGRYEDMVKFINFIDKSPRFLILDTLTAAPERTAGLLNMNFKMNAFVMEGKLPPELQTQAPTNEAAGDEGSGPEVQEAKPEAAPPAEPVARLSNPPEVVAR